MPSAAGYLYLNFERNRKRLEEQLMEIRKLHSGALFPTLHAETNILDYFIESAFEFDTEGKFFLSNTSLKPNRYKMTLRPVPTELLEEEFPEGVTLCLRGVLMPPHHQSPELLVERIIDIGSSGRKPFEIEVSAIAQPASSHRPKNVLSNQLLDKIPEISRQTRHQLEDWKEYLQWRREIIEQELSGLRYISLDSDDKHLKIRAAVQNEDAFLAIEKSLRREEMLLFPLNYSKNEWQFDYNRDSGYMNPIPLGNLRDKKYIDDAIIHDNLKCPWTDPYVVDLSFDLPKAHQLRYAGRDVPEQGFIATSLIGDLTVLQRQASAIFELELQSGYAPFLSSWLFDIEAANTPQIATPIENWLTRSINQDQQQAVKKMLEAPDVALVQGPPGTGKTTVIAEAIYQLTRQGKRVLLASQANLAVDNALEKIGFLPQIRPVRLGRSSKFSVGGQQFAEDAVLGRFYNTIASECESRFLQKDTGSAATTEELQQSLTALQSLSEAMHQINRDMEKLHVQEAHNSRQQQLADAARTKTRQLQTLRSQLLGLAEFLNGNLQQKPLVPNSLQKVIDDAIMAPLQRLTRYKIDLSADQEHSFVNVFGNWIRLRQRLKTVRADVERFAAGESHVMIAAASRSSAVQLRHDIDQLEERMENGEAGLQNTWRDLRRQLRRLHNISRLDAGLYHAIFTLRDDGIPFSQRLLNPQIERQKLVSFLEHSLQAADAVAAQIDKAIPLLTGNLRQLIKELTDLEEQQKKSFRNESGQSLGQTRARLEATFAEQQEELKERLSALEILDESEDLTSAEALEKAKELLREKIVNAGDADISKKSGDDKWRDFLQWWVELLRSPQQAENDDAEVLPQYLQSCNVVGITCNENRRLLEDRNFSRFDVTIIDEVSKATPPELLMPMMLAKKTVLVGDHRQLPPVFKEQQGSWLETIQDPQDSRAASLLTTENYHKFKQMVTASLFKKHFELSPAAIKTTLYTQYRMHPEIMEVINPFYHYSLKCGLDNPQEERNHRLSLNTSEDLPFITPQTHAVWIDSSRDPLNKPHYEKQSGTSKSNALEIDLIVALLKKLNTAANDQGHESRRPKDVGVISFYARQVWQLRQRVKAESLPALDIEVNTVDRFQGKEKSIILVSLVRNPRSGSLTNSAFVTQFERINVAFSRAQELLVIFGARRAFAECEVPVPLSEGSGMESKKVYGEIIENLNRSSNLWTSGSLIAASEHRKQTHRP